MPETDLRDLETLFLALNDKTRLRLLGLMKGGPVAVGFLADKLKESQPKISRHLAYMRNAGLVDTTRDGKWVYYEIRYPEDASRRYILETIVDSLSGQARAASQKAAARKPTSSKPRAAAGRAKNIYAETDMNNDIYVETDISEDIAEIVGPIDEEMFYGSERASERQEEMDVFLL